MQTVTIEILNEYAFNFLKDLEALKVIRVRKEASDSKSSTKKSDAAKYRGALNLTDEQYKDFQQHATDIRNEWPENI